MGHGGVWVRVFETLGQRSPDGMLLIDSSIIRARGDVIADRGDDARAVFDLIPAHGGRGHIPTQRDRKVQRSVDPALSQKRNLILRFFNKLNSFRKAVPRYETAARNPLAAVLMAWSRLWMRQHEPAS